MNIRDFWPSKVETTENIPETWEEILARRNQTFHGFLKVEKVKGLIVPGSIHMSQTQDMIRILLFRMLEEFGEAIRSDSPEHHKEELIDGLNFLYSIYYLDESLFTSDELQRALWRATVYNHYFDLALGTLDLGELTLMCSDLGDYLRNRSWMNQAQDMYFNGSEYLLDLFSSITSKIFESFTSFNEFYQYYVAKDNVLQFRITSKY